jgi:hypothetical protein
VPVTRGETEEAGGLAVSWLNFSVWKQGSVWVARKRSGCARGNRRIGASRSIRTPISGAKRFTRPKRMSPSRSSRANREIDATGTPARGVGKHPSFARAVKHFRSAGSKSRTRMDRGVCAAAGSISHLYS